MVAYHESVESIVKYGLMLISGDVNEKEALKYLTSEANRRNGQSIYSCCYTLQNGIGTTENKKETVKFFKLRRQNENNQATENDADMLYRGDGVKINKEESLI